MRLTHVTFTGVRPNVHPGDVVRCRTAHGVWVTKVARSAPRFDDANALRGRCYLTVAVSEQDSEEWVNWPAEDVEVTP